MNVLFVTEKWCGCQPSYGLANHFDNLFITFTEAQPSHKIHILHFDESAIIYNRHINDVLAQYCQAFDIRLVFFAMGGMSAMHPSLQVIQQLHAMGIKLCFIWYDSSPTELSLQQRYLDFTSLNVTIDYPKSREHDELKKHQSKHLYLWTPESQFYFRPDEQDINVSFIGSGRYADRAKYLQELTASVSLHIAGGQREQGLTYAAYAQLIRRSKININFSKNPNGYFQLKGRTLESLASQTLLIEERNPATEDFFVEGVEYVAFDNVQDLEEKIAYYLAHDNERQKIAVAGRQKFLEKYTSKHFWDIIMRTLA